MSPASQRPELFPGLPVTEGMLVPTDQTLPPVPLKHTAVEASIIGPICDVRVTQQFHNTHTRPIEALYVFPLPEDAAVTELVLTIGERVIHGELREREQAQQDYAQARDAGKRAALLAQDRPNLFSIAVANIQPDEQVQVTLRFHDRVPYDDDQFEFVFPTVVLPRYVPPEQAETEDARRVTATPLLSDGSRDGHTLSIRVELNAGKLHDISSPTHAIEVQPERGFTAVTLSEADSIPNKDFILRYRVASERLETAAFSYRPPAEPGTLLLTLTPQAELAPEDVLPRELLFVVDRSGSMGGDSIIQARNALRACLRALNPGDTFNIFPFDNHVEQFAPASLPFTQEHVDRADAYIERIGARGGTEILKALQLALQQPRDAERLRVVVFMTDGAVGNEDQVLRELGHALNEARVYAFGIGSAVNRFLLDKLAEVGRGTVEYIFPGQAIEAAVQRFQNRAAFPLLVDLHLDWGDTRVTDVYPAPLPDLYTGQPLAVLARFHNPQPLHTTVRLTGRTPRGAYAQEIAVELPAATPDRGEAWATLPQVWARLRIDALMNKERAVPKAGSKVRDEILSLALEYRLLSPYTSLVAVDEQSEAGSERADPVLVPIHLPQGTQREAFERQAQPMGAMTMAGFSGGSMHRTAAAPQAARSRGGGGGLFKLANDAMESLLGSTGQPAPSPAAARGAAAPTSAALSGSARHDAALRYLARSQDVSGAWGGSALTTALVVLAFLRGGHTDRAGSFRPQLTRAVRWLAQQTTDPAVSPAVAWALAELAATTGAAAHQAARDVALRHATPQDAWDQACLALAQGSDLSVLPNADAAAADVVAQMHNERAALAAMLGVWRNADVAHSVATALEAQQQQGGGADGAVVVPGGAADQRDGLRFAATAVGAVGWKGDTVRAEG